DGRSILTLAARFDLATQLVSQQLHAVADTEDGFLGVEHVLRYERCVRRVDAGWAARQDEALRAESPNTLLGGIVRNQLAVHVMLANPPRNELAVLRAKVDHCDSVTFSGQWSMGSGQCLRALNSLLRLR